MSEPSSFPRKRESLKACMDPRPTPPRGQALQRYRENALQQLECRAAVYLRPRNTGNSQLFPAGDELPPYGPVSSYSVCETTLRGDDGALFFTKKQKFWDEHKRGETR